MKTLSQILGLLALTSLITMAYAQEISIPDPLRAGYAFNRTVNAVEANLNLINAANL